MMSKPEAAHQWLQKMVGEWTFEGDGDCGPDKPAQKFQGTESVRSLDGMWVVAEGKGPMPDGSGTALTMMTLGYDSAKKRYVGTWVGSMMSNLWVYDGSLDAAQKVLTLESEGPNPMEPGTTGKFRDVISFESDDHRILTSMMPGPDGKWITFMTAHYRRTK